MECPLPHEEKEVITTAHGSGGKTMHELLEQYIFRHLDNEWLSARHDGATFRVGGNLAFSTDSYVVSPIVFPGGDIGELAINGTINDLAMCGAMPACLSLSLILEEGLALAELENILKSIASAADAAGVSIATGDTKVVEKGKGDKLYINTSGVGHVHAHAKIDIARIKAGMEVVLSNDIAAHGMAVMAARESLGFEADIRSDTRPLHTVVNNLLDTFGEDVIMLRDATRGGVATVLNEWADQCHLGIDIEQRSVPVQPQVNAACEMLGIDPMYVANEGAFLVIVREGLGKNVAAFLKESPDCRQAALVGSITDKHPGKVVSISSFGGKRVLGMLAGDPLPRIC
jgi:hydrogenase expression/formation protein HypE